MVTAFLSLYPIHTSPVRDSPVTFAWSAPWKLFGVGRAEMILNVRFRNTALNANTVEIFLLPLSEVI